jgi:hypothetical protein
MIAIRLSDSLMRKGSGRMFEHPALGFVDALLMWREL